MVVGGVNFRSGDNYTCRFGSVAVAAVPSSATSLDCTSPPALLGADVALAV